MNSQEVILTSTGVYHPPLSISNDELVASYNAWAKRRNERLAGQIAAGTAEPVKESSAAFIEKASGIKNRYVIEKERALDVDVMTPYIPQRPDDELCLQAEMGVKAAQDALGRSGLKGEDLDLVILSSSIIQRAYPDVSIEIQNALGAKGYAFDMSMACSSAPFGMQAAINAVAQGTASRAAVINVEISTGHLDYRDRDSHFIFGDAAACSIFQRSDLVKDKTAGYAVLGTRLRTSYSNSIRNNFGFLNHCDPEHEFGPDKLFKQKGRKVFKEVCPAVGTHLLEHLGELGVDPAGVRRFWLHQANINMNQLIARRVLGRDATEDEAPTILDEYANTSSAGAVIAMHLRSDGMRPGDVGVICAFGAGYSIGSVVLRKR